MNCITCNSSLPTDRSGFIVCSHCGTVNIPSQTDPQIHTHSSGATIASTHSSIKKQKRSNLTSRGRVLILASCLLILALGSSGAYLFKSSNKTKQPSKVVETPAKVAEQTKAPVLPPEAKAPAVTTPTVQTPTKPTKKVTEAPTTLDQIMGSINQVLAPYGVTATLSQANSSGLTWDNLSENDAAKLQQFKPYLTEEFSKYPKDFVAKSGLKTIALVKNLEVGNQGRAAAPAPDISAVVYDAYRMVNAGNEYAQQVVSHEYWHLIDYSAFGSYYYSDTEWQACNPSGFTYGAGGATAYNNASYVATFHPISNFVTSYSTYGIEEDRAEMFGWLMYDPPRVKNLNDSGINCKINRLTALVRILSPSMSF